MPNTILSRRHFLTTTAAALATTAGLTRTSFASNEPQPFALRYALPTCMYGTTALAEILPEVRKIGAETLDVWPRVHGNQREQIDQLGHDQAAALLEQHDVSLGVVTRYDLGPTRLAGEFPFAQRFGVKLLITGSGGPKGLKGDELKAAVRKFVERSRPLITAAEKQGVQIGIENHANALIESPDSIRWLAELSPSPALGIALAPYHLPQQPDLLARLITDLGPDGLVHFYAWQHGKGAHQKLPKEQELQQMPGRGPLDFAPLLAALKQINYRGLTEIFMHPVPRGIPILDSTAAVTAEINTARDYLANCLPGGP